MTNFKHIYARGDTHGDLRPLNQFAYEADTTRDDLLIILGDAGYNYYVTKTDRTDKYINDGADRYWGKLSKLPLTIAIVQGNHECPAWLIEGYKQVEFGGSVAYQHPTAPNVFYLKNGEIYVLNGRTFLVMGGADSIDKTLREIPTDEKRNVKNWFPEEQMTDLEFEQAELNLDLHDRKVDYVLTHTCPISKQPREVFLPLSGLIPDIRQEEIFEQMYPTFEFGQWLFGHYHTDRWIDDRFRVLFDTTVGLH